MSASTREDSLQGSPWRTTPRRIVVIFLLAVFFVFASFAFILDGMDMGRQPALRFAISVVLSGLFSAGYAASGMALRQRFWIGVIPILLVQNIAMILLGNWLPDAPGLSQMNAIQLRHLHNRLIFDAVSSMIAVTLGYIGFLIVSILEARRRIRLQSEKATLETEMAAAREIQRVMVPEELPPTPGYQLDSIYQPAAQVGGDFFQVIPVSHGRTFVFLGDVSGKGISAAMIVSMLIGMLRSLTGACDDPTNILAELNTHLLQRARGGFVTCLALLLDPAGCVTVANAGHLAPWLNGKEMFFGGSMPLGVLPSATPELVSMQMQPADRLVLITDGVVEARNVQGALFGFDRVQSLLQQDASALTLADAAKAYGQDDDLTIISIRRTA